MKFRTLVLAIVVGLSAVTNCQIISDINSFAGVKAEEYKVKSNSDVDVAKLANNEQKEPFIFANVYGQLPSEKVDVVTAVRKVQDYDLNSVKAAADNGSQLAENVESNPIKLADADAANSMSLEGDDEDKSFGLLTDWEIEYTEGKDDDSLEEVMRNLWNTWTDSDDTESGESEESDESESEESDESESGGGDDSESGGGDDSESEESDEDDGDKYEFNFKIPSNMAEWIQAVKQQQLIDIEAAALSDNNDMFGDNKHDYDTEISETDSASSESDASKQVEPSVDNDFNARVNPDGQVDGGYNKPTFDNKEQKPTTVEWADVEPELKEQKTDSQKFEKHNVIGSEGRPLHVYSAFHYVFFAISGTLFILGLMVLVGAIIRNMRYKTPSYVIMVEAGMSGKM